MRRKGQNLVGPLSRSVRTTPRGIGTSKTLLSNFNHRRSITTCLPTNDRQKTEYMHWTAKFISGVTNTEYIPWGKLSRMDKGARERLLKSEPLFLIAEHTDINRFHKFAPGTYDIAEHGAVVAVKQVFDPGYPDDDVVDLETMPGVTLLYCHSKTGAEELSKVLERTPVVGFDAALKMQTDAIMERSRGFRLGQATTEGNALVFTEFAEKDAKDAVNSFIDGQLLPGVPEKLRNIVLALQNVPRE